METEIKLDSLTADQLLQLEQSLKARKKADKQQRYNEIVIYKDLVKHTVVDQIGYLQEINSMLSLAKVNVFNNFITIIQMKHELYGIKSGQQSHTFTDDHGNSIKLGYRILDRYDDTVDEGIAFINKYIDSKAVDDNTAELVKKLYKLLKKDVKGNLKPSRVIELQNIADEDDDENLKRGVEIIRKSYKPVRSVMFIEAETNDELGKKQNVDLSISSADFPEGSNVDFSLFDTLKKEDEINSSKIHLCESCQKLVDFPACIPKDVEFGDGKGKDNIIKCADYKPVTTNSHG